MNELIQIADADLPTTPIKLVYFDIDGTLLNQHGQYPSQLQSALRRIQNMGVKTAVASGRPQFAAQWLIDDLGLTAPGVFCTGAHIYHPASGAHLQQQFLPLPTLVELVDAMRRLDVYYELYTAEHFYIERDTAAFIRATHAQHLRVAPAVKHFDDIIGAQPVIKLLIGANQPADIAAVYELERAFSDRCVFAYAKLPAYPDWLFASIIDIKADKQAAFNYLLAHHQLTAEQVMSFGDAQSDKQFLQAAGVGVAMGNAAPDVKAVARFTTKAVWDDGIAYALARLIPDC
ncbi:MAG TPA: HAD family hydrolase [Marinagarivorans sp.]|nr:HAD family hydrolase [Cellvibrionaceae bacterium]HMY39891.1 HAD family hydrolase [Marinagarivorans sp.]HNG61973.1 HAD family hydrolase [Cellvibrionaceae bacterium]